MYGDFQVSFLEGQEQNPKTKDGETDCYDIEYLKGLEVVNIEGSLVSVIDLKNDENVHVGKRDFKSPIAVVPSQGYTKRDNYSKISIQWLEWLMEKSRQRGNPIRISHALNGGEYQIPGTNYRCDGFVHNSSGKGTIYEFYGKTVSNYFLNICPLFPSTEGGGGAAAAAYLMLIKLIIIKFVCIFKVVSSTVAPLVTRMTDIISSILPPIRRSRNYMK